MPDIENVSAQERTKEITDKLEKGIKELFEGEKFKEYLNTMSKFHNYSFNNRNTLRELGFTEILHL